MSKNDLKMIGNYGYYLDEDNVISFEIGSSLRSSLLEPDPAFPLYVDAGISEPQWQSIQGFQVCSRGYNNMKCEEIASDIKKNRLLPRLISKQI